MTKTIQEYLNLPKEIRHLVSCIAHESDEAVTNIKANGVCLDKLKDRIAIAKKDLTI